MQSLLTLQWVINCVVASEVQCFYAVLSLALCCCTALFPFNFRYFFRDLFLSGKKLNGLSGSKLWYLFQRTCPQTGWCALGWLYLGWEDSCLCQDHRMTCLFERSLKWWVVAFLVRQSCIWLQYLCSTWPPICCSSGGERFEGNTICWFHVASQTGTSLLLRRCSLLFLYITNSCRWAKICYSLLILWIHCIKLKSAIWSAVLLRNILIALFCLLCYVELSS